jgi:hypothetical protein
MKKILYSVLSLTFMVLFFTSCDKTYTDLTTADAKTGGLISPTKAIPYKLGSTPSFNVILNVLQGPGIKSIEIYRTYTGKTEVLDQTVDVASANTTADKAITVSYNYTKLITGLSMPANESQLKIGDAWTLRYVSVMEDGRKVDNPVKTAVAVANFFAGSYAKEVKYFHPTAGGTYPTTPYSLDKSTVSLVAKNAYECDDWFGVWSDNKLTIHIDPAANYAVTRTFVRTDGVVGDPYNAANVPSYNPATGVIKLYYYYMGASGPRIFWATYTPK